MIWMKALLSGCGFTIVSPFFATRNCWRGRLGDPDWLICRHQRVLKSGGSGRLAAPAAVRRPGGEPCRPVPRRCSSAAPPLLPCSLARSVRHPWGGGGGGGGWKTCGRCCSSVAAVSQNWSNAGRLAWPISCSAAGRGRRVCCTARQASGRDSLPCCGRRALSTRRRPTVSWSESSRRLVFG